MYDVRTIVSTTPKNIPVPKKPPLPRMTEDQLRKAMAADVPAWAKPRKFQPAATGSRIDGISDKIMAWVKENPDQTNFAIAKAIGHTKGAVGDRLRQMANDGRLVRYQKRQRGSWFYTIKEAE